MKTSKFLDIQKRISYILMLGLFAILPQSLFSSEVMEVPMEVDDTNKIILAILAKVDPEGYVEDYNTEGFVYKYHSTFLSPFNNRIYIGKMSQRSIDSIVRVESRSQGEEKVWRQILETELLRNPPEEGSRKLDPKSHFYTQSLNLIQPSFSVMYNSWDSPLYNTSDTFWSSTVYLVVDAILVGGAYFYATNKTPNKTIWDNMLNRSGPKPVLQGPDAGAILGALAVTRLYRMMGGIQDTRAHNRLVNLEYSFKF